MEHCDSSKIGIWLCWWKVDGNFEVKCIIEQAMWATSYNQETHKCTSAQIHRYTNLSVKTYISGGLWLWCAEVKHNQLGQAYLVSDNRRIISKPSVLPLCLAVSKTWIYKQPILFRQWEAIYCIQHFIPEPWSIKQINAF